MTSNLKAVLFILGSVLAIFGGEVLKQSLTSWAQITSIQFIAGLLVQIGGLIGAIAGGISYDPEARTFKGGEEL